MFVCIHKPIIKYTIIIYKNQCLSVAINDRKAKIFKKTDLTADFYANKIEIRGNEKKRGK